MEDHYLYTTPVCPHCDDAIADEPVGYVEPVEIEGVGVVHGHCAEELLEEDDAPKVVS